MLQALVSRRPCHGVISRHFFDQVHRGEAHTSSLFWVKNDDPPHVVSQRIVGVLPGAYKGLAAGEHDIHDNSHAEYINFAAIPTVAEYLGGYVPRATVAFAAVFGDHGEAEICD